MSNPTENRLDEFSEMLTVLKSDVDSLQQSAKADQSARRSFVRAVFAMIEGLTYSLKQGALEKEETQPVFTTAELALLKEEFYDLNDNGEAAIRRSKLRTKPNTLFALQSFAKGHGAIFVPNRDEGWSALIAAIKVRDRLMHPKKIIDLTVSDAEMETVKEASLWFQLNCVLAIDKVLNVLQKKLQEVESHREELESRKDEIEAEKVAKLAKLKSNTNQRLDEVYQEAERNLEKVDPERRTDSWQRLAETKRESHDRVNVMFGEIERGQADIN